MVTVVIGVAGYLIAAALLWPGTRHWTHLGDFGKVIRSQVPLMGRLSILLAGFVAVAEVAVGTQILVSAFVGWHPLLSLSLRAAAVMLLLFSVWGLVLLLASRRDVPCGCDSTMS